jgi:Leucine-rich repeat (LRR) protein
VSSIFNINLSLALPGIHHAGDSSAAAAGRAERTEQVTQVFHDTVMTASSSSSRGITPPQAAHAETSSSAKRRKTAVEIPRIAISTYTQKDMSDELNSWVNSELVRARRAHLVIAKDKILHCYRNQLQFLDLSNLHLTTLPECIEKLSQLRSLTLNRNNFTTLPSFIGNLSQLTKLSLSHNQLDALPSFVVRLNELSLLDVSANQISHFPNFIVRLTKLTHLYMSNNQLHNLPRSIGRLTKLLELNVNHNELVNLPAEILNLSEDCLVLAEYNLFTSVTCQRLRAQINAEDFRGPRITFAPRINRERASHQTIEELLQDLTLHAHQPQTIVLNNLPKNDLRLWLSRLVDVGDYQQSTSRQTLARMIYDAIVRAEEDPVFRNIFQSCIIDAETTCGDRMALSVLYLGLNSKIAHSLETLNLQQLSYLLIHGTMALNYLEKIAKAKETLCNINDSIEVLLSYPLMLKEKLDLALDIETMLFFPCSGVKEEDLLSAETLLQCFFDNKEWDFEAIMQQDFWEKFWRNFLKNTSKNKEDIKRIFSENFLDNSAHVNLFLEAGFLENQEDPSKVFTKEFLRKKENLERIISIALSGKHSNGDSKAPSCFAYLAKQEPWMSALQKHPLTQEKYKKIMDEKEKSLEEEDEPDYEEIAKKERTAFVQLTKEAYSFVLCKKEV